MRTLPLFLRARRVLYRVPGARGAKAKGRRFHQEAAALSCQRPCGPKAGAKPSALTGFETALGLVDDVHAALTANDPAISMPRLQGPERISDLHRSFSWASAWPDGNDPDERSASILLGVIFALWRDRHNVKVGRHAREEAV